MLKIAVALVAPMALFAQAPGNGGFVTQLVKTGLYLISGASGNSLLRFSANGLILVDGTRPEGFRPLMSQVRKTSKIGDEPLRFVVLTDYHTEHAGADAQFVAAGARIVAQEQAARRLPGLGAPALTYESERTLRLGGVEARLLHFGQAHTDGDTVVYFPDLRVVALGHLMSGPPKPDANAGGSLAGWRAALDQVLRLDFEVAIPGSGPPVSRAEVKIYRDRLDAQAFRGPVRGN